jgi:hypothetical protein
MLAASAVCRAQAIGAYVGTPTLRNDGNQVVGVTLNSYGVTISSLGFFDYGDDGLSGSYQVGLWDSSQNLLDSVTITSSSPLYNGFRYEPITPVTIGSFATPQAFTIGAYLPNATSDIWYSNVFVILATGLTGAGAGQYTSPAASLVFPVTPDSPAYYVVNANGPVPEPASIAILAVAAIPFMGRRRRK